MSILFSAKLVSLTGFGCIDYLSVLLVARLRQTPTNRLTLTWYRPRHRQIVPGLPKTRSGKIMRRILRKIAADRPDELGDISTLQDPAVVERIVQLHRQQAQ